MTLKTKTCNKMYWPMWHLFNEISAWSLMSLATGMWGIHSITIRCISIQWFTAFAGCLLTLSVIHHSVHLNSKHQPEVGSIAAGGSFGELALLYFAPRAATIQAKNVKAIWCADSMDVHRTNPPGANSLIRLGMLVQFGSSTASTSRTNMLRLSKQMRKFSRLKCKRMSLDK